MRAGKDGRQREPSSHRDKRSRAQCSRSLRARVPPSSQARTGAL